MRNYSSKQIFTVFAATLCILVLALAGTAAAKSVYLIANHHTAQFDAWEQNPDGTIDYQANYGLTYATDPAGVAIWEDPNSDAAYLFVTSEFRLAGVELVDADTMTSIGKASAPYSNLAGIDIDDANLVVYVMRRGSSSLLVYDWDPATLTLTPQIGSPFTLPGCSGAYGIAFNETTGILWVADGSGGTARAYDVTSMTEDMSKSFAPSHNPIDIAVDRSRGIVYTVSMSFGAGGPGGSRLLSKYDLATRTETMGTLSCQGVGVAVEELTGYVYVTVSPYCASPYQGQIQAWDTSCTPWIQIDAKTVTGSPAGIAIGSVSVNPLNLAKNDVIQGGGVSIGSQFTYKITCDNVDNATQDATNVSILDTLPVELNFVSATNGGVYDGVTHTVLWDIGTIPAGQSWPEINLVVKVNQNATPGSTINNYCTIEYTLGGQGGSTTVTDDENSDDPNDEPGTPVLPNIPVAVDIKPGSCPNPLNPKSGGVLPVAVLGTEDFDVTTIDPCSIALNSEEKSGSAPIRSDYEDVATPFEGDLCDCHDLNGDGYMDLTLKFDKKDLIKKLSLKDENLAGDTIPLTLTGNLNASEGDTPIIGQDCIWILDK